VISGDPYSFDPTDSSLDPEVVRLCTSLNRIPGLGTVESCCGHDSEDFIVWFRARDLNVLRFLARLLCPRLHASAPGSREAMLLITLDHGNCMNEEGVLWFCLVGPPGHCSYEAANRLADEIDACLGVLSG
jgi:hypothetical protein